MERFKAIEKELKTKAFSKEGLGLPNKVDPEEAKKMSAVEWINETVDLLHQQIDGIEAQKELLVTSTKKSSASSSSSSSSSSRKSNNHYNSNNGGSSNNQMEKLKYQIERHRQHVKKLEVALRMLENEVLSADQIEDVKSFVDTYIEQYEELDNEDDRLDIYNDLGLEEEEELFGTIIIPCEEQQQQQNLIVGPIISCGGGSLQVDNNEQSDDSIKKYSLQGNLELNPSLPKKPPSSSDQVSPNSSKSVTNGSDSSPSTEVDNIISSPTQLSLSGEIQGVNSSKNAPWSQKIREQMTLRSFNGEENVKNSITGGIKQPSYSIQDSPENNKSLSPLLSTPLSLATATALSTITSAINQRISPTSAGSTAMYSAVGEFSPNMQQQNELSPIYLNYSTPPTSMKTITNLTPYLIQSNLPRKIGEGGIFEELEYQESNVQIPTPLADLAAIFLDAKSKVFGPGGRAQKLTINSIDQIMVDSLHNSLPHIPKVIDNDRVQPYDPRAPTYDTPSYYPQYPLGIFDNPLLFKRLDLDTLFYIFYFQQGTYQQLLAATELRQKSWRFHTRHRTWFQRFADPITVTNDYEHGTYIFFDYEGGWQQKKKANFTFEYKFLEESN